MFLYRLALELRSVLSNAVPCRFSEATLSEFFTTLGSSKLVLGDIEILHINYRELNIADILGSGLDWYPVAYGSHNCTFSHT